MKFTKINLDEDLIWEEDKFNEDIPLEEILYWDDELNSEDDL